jgi:peptidoglycan/LPS O-acetylase OafA/YrhL
MEKSPEKPPKSPPANARFAGLDALRGLAILLVVAAHYLPSCFPASQVSFIISFGGAGVLLFFYLSGFLIYRNIQKQTLGVFLSRRFFKLIPAYWVNIAVIVGVAVVLKNTEPISIRTILANLFLLQEFDGDKVLSGVFWTLQIEVKFYLLIAAFCYFVGPRRIYWVFAVLLLLNAALLPVLGRGSTVVTYLICFFPGIAAARALERAWDRPALLEFAAVTCLAGLNLFFALDYLAGYQAFYALLFSALVLVALTINFQSRLLAFFGRISYSDYLFHVMVGLALISMLADDSYVSRSVALVAAVAASTAVAALCYRFVEKPCINVGLKWEKTIPAWPLLRKVCAGERGLAIPK